MVETDSTECNSTHNGLICFLPLNHKEKHTGMKTWNQEYSQIGCFLCKPLHEYQLYCHGEETCICLCECED